MTDEAEHGARRAKRTRRAAVRPIPSEASGLRAVPQAPTMQPTADTPPPEQQVADTDGLTDTPHAGT